MKGLSNHWVDEKSTLFLVSLQTAHSFQTVQQSSIPKQLAAGMCSQPYRGHYIVDVRVCLHYEGSSNHWWVDEKSKLEYPFPCFSSNSSRFSDSSATFNSETVNSRYVQLSRGHHIVDVRACLHYEGLSNHWWVNEKSMVRVRFSLFYFKQLKVFRNLQFWSSQQQVYTASRTGAIILWMWGCACTVC